MLPTDHIPDENKLNQVRNRFVFESLDEDWSDVDSYEMALERLANEFEFPVMRVKKKAHAENWLGQREANQAQYRHGIEVANFKQVEKIVKDKIAAEEQMVSQMQHWVDATYPKLMTILDSRVHMMSDKDLLSYAKLMIDTMHKFIAYNQSKASLASQAQGNEDVALLKQLLSLEMKDRMVSIINARKGGVPAELMVMLDKIDNEQAGAFASLEKGERIQPMQVEEDVRAVT